MEPPGIPARFTTSPERFDLIEVLAYAV